MKIKPEPLRGVKCRRLQLWESPRRIFDEIKLRPAAYYYERTGGDDRAD